MVTTSPQIPPLESGDRLTRTEFHRRYCAHPQIKQAELVEGVVYVASPVSAKFHGRPHSWVVGWLVAYKARAPEVELADNATVYLDADNELQPDVCLFWDPSRGGGARLTDDGYIEGAPQFVCEIAASSASYDMHDKLRAYRRAGVQEYAVWLVYEERFIWQRLQEGEYRPVEPDERGLIESKVFPGLRLDVPALLAGDLARVLAALN